MNQPAKILVVDEKSTFLRATCRLLESAGYISIGAPTGAEALRLAAEHKPDLVLVNANLPDITGFEVCKQIKKDARLLGMFVVILSARNSSDSSQSEDLETGADGYITRPIPKRELLVRVQALLRVHSAEAALRKSEELFRTMTNFTQDWEYWIGPERELLYISPSCEAVSGYPAREFRERPDLLEKIVHPVDLAALLDHEETFFHSPQASSLEIRIITRSGEVRWIVHNCRPVYDAEGRWQGRRASNRDITGRKMVIEVLERQNRTLNFLQEIAQEINGELEISTLLHNIMQRAVDLSRADRGGGIYLYEADKNILRLVEGAGINQERVGITIGIDEGVSGHVFRSAKPLVVDNYTDWKEHSVVLVEKPPSTVMGIPLLVKGQVIGVLTLIANSRQRTFTEEDTRLAGMFAAQASIAIQNAQLYGKAQQEINERKRAEEQLKYSEERYKTLLENTGTGIVILNRDGVYQSVNQRAADRMGARPEDIIGRSLFDFFPQETAQFYLEQNQKVIDSGIGRESEDTYQTPTGERTYLSIDQCLKDAKGQAIGMQSSCIEITERKQAEKVLRESEERFRSIFENSGDAILLTSPDGKVYAANPAACRMFGRSEAEICRLGRGGLIDASDPRLPAALQTRRLTGKFHGVLTHLRRGGQPFPGEITSTVFQEGGEIRTSMIIRDITARMQAEEDLRQTNEKLELLFEILPVGVSVLDQDNRVMKSNLALEKILDMSKKDLLNASYVHRRYIKADRTSMPEEEFPSHRVLRGENGVTNQQVGIVKENGELVWTEVNATSCLFADWRVVLVTSDITGRKRAEEELHKSHEQLRTLTFRLAQVEESQRRNMARELHDRVGQNLTALNINLNIIRSQLPADDAQKIGSRMDDSARLVEETIDDVRDVMADLRPPLLEDYGLLAALRQYAEQFALRTRLVVKVLESSKLFPRLSLDVETALFRVAQEALNNVAKHARASQVIIRAEADGEIVRLIVADDGQGFGLPEAARDEKAPGWGLISMRERVEAMGGTFQVDSVTGKGVQIILEIPYPPSTLLSSGRPVRNRKPRS
jgi:PAS domain S-box-containing protein